MPETVLVLEDDKGIAELIRRQLARNGIACEVSVSSESALKRLTGSPVIDLVIFDYQLNERASGLEFYRDAVANGWRGASILITGFGNENIILDALRSGVDDVFPKTPDFIDTLARTVRRLLDERRREAELEFLKSERQVHQRVEAAFRAANVSSWAWITSTRQLHWAGSPLSESLASPSDQLEIPVERIKSLLGSYGWRELLHALASSRKSGRSFECELPVINEGQTRWWLVRGAWRGENAVPSGIAVDVTERRVADQNLRASMEEVRRLNDRLKFSITETHHRVKNSLQVVSSLLSMEFRRGKGLDDAGLWRLMGHVRALAALHDLLTDRSRDGRDLSGISVSDFLRSLEGVLRRLIPHLDAQIADSPLELAPRRASALAVIVTELAMNAAKHGDGKVGMVFRITELGYAVQIMNPALSESDALASWTKDAPAGTGLELVNTLLRSDFTTDLQMEFSDGQCIAAFNLPKNPAPERPRGAFQ